MFGEGLHLGFELGGFVFKVRTSQNGDAAIGDGQQRIHNLGARSLTVPT